MKPIFKNCNEDKNRWMGAGGTRKSNKESEYDQNILYVCKEISQWSPTLYN
jgi:hypothetical protein